jgi:phosphoribosylformylglycinamidine synthase subunit PurSL
MLGAEVDLSLLPSDGPLDDDAKIFSESNSRFVVTCAPENQSALEELFRDLPCSRIGEVSAEPRLCIAGEGGRKVVDIDIEMLRRSFKETLDGV